LESALVRRQKIGRGRIDGAALLRFQVRIVLHRGEETHRAVRIVAGARRDADADRIGLEFLRPRKVHELEFRFRQRQRADFRIADHVGDGAAGEIGVAGFLFALLGVSRDDVAHLVGEHGGELGLVVGKRDQAARHIDLAGRQCEGIDRLRIEHGDLVVLVGLLRRRDQALHGLLDHGLQAGIVVDAAIGGEDALMFALHRRRQFGPRRRLDRRYRSRLRRNRWRRRGARRQQQRSDCRAGMPKPQTCDPRTSPLHRHVTCIHLTSAVSICSGYSASIQGLCPVPPRASIKPRTRMRRPASPFKSRPAAVKLRSFRFRIVTAKFSDQRRPKFT
jgi:hypothetical protein